MNIKKNKKYQYLFFLILLFVSIFNGGNSNILIQLNFILSSSLFIYCLNDKNYSSHLKYFYKKNKSSILIYIFFLLYLLFQIIPFPLEFLILLSKEKYIYLKDLNYNNVSSISLSPSNTFFQFLNYFSIFLIILITKMIFYNYRHIFRFYF